MKNVESTKNQKLKIADRNKEKIDHDRVASLV